MASVLPMNYMRWKMMNKIFADTGWEDYLYWQKEDSKTLKKSSEGLPLPFHVKYLSGLVYFIQFQDQVTDKKISP